MISTALPTNLAAIRHWRPTPSTTTPGELPSQVLRGTSLAIRWAARSRKISYSSSRAPNGSASGVLRRPSSPFQRRNSSLLQIRPPNSSSTRSVHCGRTSYSSRPTRATSWGPPGSLLARRHPASATQTSPSPVRRRYSPRANTRFPLIPAQVPPKIRITSWAGRIGTSLQQLSCMGATRWKRATCSPAP